MQTKSESFKNPLYFSMQAWGVVEEPYVISVNGNNESIVFEKKKLVSVKGELLTVPIKYFFANLANAALGMKLELKINNMPVQCQLTAHHVSIFEQYNEWNNFNKYHYTAEYSSMNEDKSSGETYFLHVYISSKNLAPMVELRNTQKVIQVISASDQNRFCELARDMTTPVMLMHEKILADRINGLLARQNKLLQYDDFEQGSNPETIEEAQSVVEEMEGLINKYGVSARCFNLSGIKSYITLISLPSYTALESDKSFLVTNSIFNTGASITHESEKNKNKTSRHKNSARKTPKKSKPDENSELSYQELVREMNSCVAASLERLKLYREQLPNAENIIAQRMSFYQEIQHIRCLCKYVSSSLSELDREFIKQCEEEIKKEFINKYPLLFLKTDDNFIDMTTRDDHKVLAELWMREIGDSYLDDVEEIVDYCVRNNFPQKIKLITETTGMILSPEQKEELYTVVRDNDYFECFKSLTGVFGNEPGEEIVKTLGSKYQQFLRERTQMILSIKSYSYMTSKVAVIERNAPDSMDVVSLRLLNMWMKQKKQYNERVVEIYHQLTHN